MGIAEWVLVGLGICTLFLSAIIAAVTATRVIDRSNRAVADSADKKLATLTHSVTERSNRDRHDYGEALAAVRQKITDVEMWNRDHFVTKESFDRLEEGLKDISRAVSLIPAMNVKIDTMWNFQVRRAMSEVQDSGIGTTNSPLMFSEDAKRALDPIKDELIKFNETELQGVDDADALLAIERQFGERLYELVCKPCQLSHGACLLLACAVARQVDKLVIVLHG